MMDMRILDTSSMSTTRKLHLGLLGGGWFALNTSQLTCLPKALTDQGYANVIVHEPWRLLPVEILQYIFIAVHECGSKRVIPLTLALVCKTWHDAALGTPHLWTYAEIRDDMEVRAAQF